MHIERTTFGTIDHVLIRLSGDVVKITAELPGMEEKDIEVNVSHDVLRIKSEKKEGKKKGSEHYASFERSFHIPDSVDVNKIEASFRNGILTVTLPKTAEAQKQAKKIEVKKG